MTRKREKDALKWAGRRVYQDKFEKNGKKRTLVVEGVTETKDAQNCENEGCSASIVAVKKATLYSSDASGSVALGQLGVEVDKRSKSCA